MLMISSNISFDMLAIKKREKDIESKWIFDIFDHEHSSRGPRNTFEDKALLYHFIHAFLVTF